MIVPARSPEDRGGLVAWIAERVREQPDTLVGAMPFEVAAAVESNKIKGAVLYSNYRGVSIEMTCAGEPGWLTKGNLRGFFSYPFEQLKCRRVTAIVHADNARSRDLVERLGFKSEGVCRDGFADGDACIYGMIRSDCRWI